MLSSLKALGSYAVEHPTRSAIAAGVGMYGTAQSINAVLHPIDTASSVAKFGLAATRNPSETGTYAGVAALGALGVAAVGGAAYGVGKTARGRAIVGGAAKVAGYLPNKIAHAPGRALSKAVGGYAAAWEKLGPKVMFPAAAGLGVMYGGAKAVAKIATSTPTYDSAMARSTEGSAYEQGPQAFGRRGQGSKLNTLGQSAVGLTQGLHNAR